MSAPTLRDTAAELARATSASEAIRVRVAAHEAQTETDRGLLTKLEGELQAHHMAVALGDEEIPPAPDTAGMEELRLKLGVAHQIKLQLESRTSTANGAVRKAEKAHQAAICRHLMKNTINPALADLDAAWEQVGQALIKIMAGHYLAYVKYDDGARLPNGYNDLYGPAAHLVSFLRERRWEDWPYNVAPEWVLGGGRVGQHGLSDVDNLVRQLTADVEEVAA